MRFIMELGFLLLFRVKNRTDWKKARKDKQSAESLAAFKDVTSLIPREDVTQFLHSVMEVREFMLQHPGVKDVVRIWQLRASEKVSLQFILSVLLFHMNSVICNALVRYRCKF